MHYDSSDSDDQKDKTSQDETSVNPWSETEKASSTNESTNNTVAAPKENEDNKNQPTENTNVHPLNADNPWGASSDKETPKKPKNKVNTPPQSPWQDITKSFDAYKNKLNNDAPFNRSQSSGSRGPRGPVGTGQFNEPPINGKVVGFGFAIVCALWLASGIFRVQETDMAAIMRLGKFTKIVGPGLQYRLPFPFEQEIIRNVTANNVMNSEGRTSISRTTADKSDKTLVLTGDENIIDISYTVTWKIKDLPAYLFHVRNPDMTILAATESIIREVIGQTEALSALTDERDAISQKASEMLQKVMDSYNMGVQIVKVELQRVEPPKEVVEAFNDMQASLTDGDGLRIKAEAYRSEVVPKARGEASKIAQEAEGYAQQVVARAQGEADRFTSIYEQYKKNPTVSARRLYIDTLESILSKSPKILVDAKAAPGIVPYLNLQPQGTVKANDSIVGDTSGGKNAKP